MRKLIVGVAAAFLAIAAPGMASADSNAVVAFTVGNGEPDGADDSNFFGLNAGFSHEMMNGWTLQVDGAHHRVDAGADINTSYAAVGLGVRNDQYSLGGFVGMHGLSGLDATSIGVNGQLFLSQAVINGSVGFATQDDVDVDVTNISVDGTWFFNDNLGLSLQVGHTEIDNGTDEDYNTIGAGVEYRFTDSPFSVGFNYAKRDPDAGDVDVWQISLAMDLGTGSLSERARSGPSWNGARRVFEEFEAAIF